MKFTFLTQYFHTVQIQINSLYGYHTTDTEFSVTNLFYLHLSD